MRLYDNEIVSALERGQRIYREVWGANILARQDNRYGIVFKYISCHPYPLSILDIVADDWNVLDYENDLLETLWIMANERGY